MLRLKPDIVILEIGVNDGFRGIDPEMTRKNIDESVLLLKAHRVTVVLAGMRMLTNTESEFNKAFAAIYPAVALEHGLILIPHFLAGVTGAGYRPPCIWSERVKGSRRLYVSTASTR